MGEWRAQLPPDFRKTLINKIIDTLKKRLQVSGQSQFADLTAVAKKFEEKVYFASDSKDDYVRKIRMEMTRMLPASRNNLNASQNVQLQVHSQGHSFPVSVEKNEGEMHQESQQQDIPNNTTTFRMQSFSDSQTSQSPFSSLTQSQLPNVAVRNASMNTNSGVPQSAISVPSDMLVSSRPVLQGKLTVQQFVSQQLFKQQPQQHPLKQNLQQSNISHALPQPHVQQEQQQQYQIQQQQLQSQQNMVQSSQQCFLQTSSSMQPALMQPGQISNSLQLNQQPLLLQSTRPQIPQDEQTIPRQQQQQQTSFKGRKQKSESLQSNQMLSQQLIAQQKVICPPPDSENMQQNQVELLNCISEMQQKEQKQISLGPEGTRPSIQLQQRPSSQANQYLNIEEQHATQSDKSIVYCHAQGSVLNESRVSEQAQQNMPAMQSAQGSLRNAQQHFARIQPPSLQKRLCLSQRKILLQEGAQQRNPQSELLQQQTLIHQQEQHCQSHRVFQDSPSSSLECVDQAQDDDGSSSREAIYEKLKTMKDLYSQRLFALYKRVVAKGEMGPNTPVDKQKVHKKYKVSLEFLIRILNTPKCNITASHEAKLQVCEKMIARLFTLHNVKKSTGLLQQTQQPQAQSPQVQQCESELNSQLPSQTQNSQEPQGSLTNPMQQISSGPLQHSLDTNQHAGVKDLTSQTNMSHASVESQLMHKQQELRRQQVHQTSEMPESLQQHPSSSQHSLDQNQLHRTASDHEPEHTASVGLSTRVKSYRFQSPLLVSLPSAFSAPSTAMDTEKPSAPSPSLPQPALQEAPEILPGKTNVEERPIERLLRAVKLLSPRDLNESLNSIKSVVRTTDMFAASAFGNGGKAAHGVDLSGATSSNVMSSCVNDSSGQQGWQETSEMGLNATSCIKRTRYASLFEEIGEINSRLIDTVLDVSHEDADETKDNDGMIVQCSFIAVAMSRELKSHYTSGEVLPIQPLRLLIPSYYPASSPVLLDQIPSVASGELEDLSWKAKTRFSYAISSSSKPLMLGEMARMWEECCHQVILEYVQKTGGGTFTSQYGPWVLL